MPQFLSIVHKELRLLYRRPDTLVLLILMPFLLVAVLSEAFEPLVVGRPHFEVSVIDLDGSAGSEQLLARLRGMEGIDLRLRPWKGARFREADAERMFREGRRFAALVIPEGFGDSMRVNGAATLTLYGDPARMRYVDIVHDELHGRLLIDDVVDSLVRSVAETTGTSQEDVRRAIGGVLKSTVASPALSLETIPVSERQTFPSAFEQTVPGFAVMFGFLTAFYITLNLYRERTEFCTWLRTLLAPVSRMTILSARIIAYTLLGIAQFSVMLLLSRALWGMSLGDSPLALWLVIGCLSLVSTSFGLMVGSLFKETEAQRTVIYMSVIVLGALGGALLPVAFLPDWMQPLSVATPQFWAIDAIQDLIVRGRDLVDIVPQLGVLLAFAAVFLAVSYRSFRFTD